MQISYLHTQHVITQLGHVIIVILESLDALEVQ